jgi:hypothetical protein
VRSTPIKGTPERAKLQADAEGSAKRLADINAAIDKKKKQQDKETYGYPKYKVLDDQIDVLRGQQRDEEKRLNSIQEKQRLAALEDGFESSTDEGQRLAIQHEIARMSPDWNTRNVAAPLQEIKDLALKMLEARTADPALRESVALDAASMVMGYPLSRTLAQQVDISLRVKQREIERDEFVKKFDGMNLSDIQRKDAISRIKNAYETSEMEAVLRGVNETHRNNEEVRKTMEEQESLAASAYSFDSSLASAPPKKVTPVSLISLLKTNHLRWNFLASAQQTGWATNGLFAVKMDAKDINALNKEPPAEGRGPDVLSMLKTLKSGTPAEIKGARVNPHSDPNKKGVKHDALIEDQSGNQAVVNMKFLDIVRSRYPKSEIRISRKDGPVIFTENGNIVGVVMPMILPGKHKTFSEHNMFTADPKKFSESPLILKFIKGPRHGA